MEVLATDTEKSSGSRMLKKAKSFRDDVKGLIKRRPSSSSQDASMTEARQNFRSSKQRTSSRSVSRAGSVSDDRKGEQLPDDNDVDKLQEEVNKVYRSLNFIKAVVDHEKLQVIPGTATVVLESVMDVFTMHSNFFLAQDSSVLTSRHKKVCQCLARFIQWADKILLQGNKSVDKQTAHELISALSDGIEELKLITVDKLQDKKNNQLQDPTVDQYSNRNESLKRSSLPEIPLTPREKQILEHTSEIGIYDNTTFPVSRSSDSIANSPQPESFTFKDPSPPPKPPLPKDPDVVHRLVTQASQEEQTDGPPPIPQKENRHSLTNVLNRLSGQGTTSPHNSMIFSETSSSPNQSPHSSLVFPSHVMPLSQSPHSSVVLSDRGTPQSQSPHSSMFFTPSPSQSPHNSVILTGQSTPNQSPHTSMVFNTSSCHLSEQSSVLSQRLVLGDHGSPLSVSPNTRSSASSLGSGLNRSSEDLVDSNACQRNDRANSFSLASTESHHGNGTSSQETYSSTETFSSASHSSLESLPKPPPLPPKKRHVQAYMQTIGNYTQPTVVSDCLYSRHSINFYEAQWQQHQMELHPPLYPRSNTISVISDLSSDSSFSSSAPNSPAIPPLPTKKKNETNRGSHVSIGSNISDNSLEFPREKAASLVEGPTQNNADSELKRSSAPPGNIPENILPQEPPPDPNKSEIQKDCDSDFAELNPLDDIDVSDQLLKKKEGEDGPEIRGGSIDALIVHATSVGKSAFMYQEAFLTTYRTFIVSQELIDKLLYRFHKFQHASDKKKKVSRNTFSLLIRVIDELSPKELEDSVIEKMMNLVFELLCQGELMLAKVLRKKIIEKCESIKAPADPIASMTFTSSITLKSSPSDLLLFKSHDIAEQMTLLDAELFQKIEIHEVSLWAKEQSEELSPNLTEFTEHFNKMSYWCRTQILTPEDAKDREKYLLKFIKIMRHLRKLSNFNSYLAILSAVDSAPIRRLDWPRQNLEALKEFCQLIDSSSSFRAYRQALAETEPPCIPYIGLILQDLTFINIGNQDYLLDGNINFAKRWQQFNILDNMRRFKKCNYQIQKNEKIINVFNNFDDYLSEDSLWQISEKIRPRGGAKKRIEVAES
ncbi:hypothetical protein FSP39_006537 [Pinctada imbricata]|uniref:CRK SH3-binding GNRP n=1 Tax=Pinctada imbricata TaxID=66713 RepID=A0AA88XRZ0_PINIB|nr:hypothetical protein FSP39_006537 [Pinctada imbricata]